MPEDMTMEGVTDQTVTLQVSPGQFEQLSRDQLIPGRPRVTHKIGVGPFSLPGVYVVTAVSRRVEPPQTTYWVTLSLLEA